MKRHPRGVFQCGVDVRDFTRRGVTRAARALMSVAEKKRLRQRGLFYVWHCHFDIYDNRWIGRLDAISVPGNFHELGVSKKMIREEMST